MIIRYVLHILVVVLLLPFVLGQGAQFQVTSLTCTDISVGGTFSCTATILNAGDAAATPGTITLFPDSSDWMEKGSYPVAGSTIDNGESVEITFVGLKAVKSGSANGFSQVRIDDVTDTSSTVTGLKANAVDIAVAVTTSPASVAQGKTFTATAEATAGGNVDVALTFTVDSGGCSIGNEDAQKNISGMKHGAKQSRTWTVTQGSGNCKFTVTATATGSATKTDTTDVTVSCTDCSSGGGGGAAGGGGGGGGTVKASVGELTTPVIYELGRGEKLNFLSEGETHSVTVSSLTATTANLVVQSHPQSVQMTVGEEKSFDLNDDGQNDLLLKLNSINVITKKVKVTLTPLRVQAPQEGESGEPTTTAPQSGGGEQPGTSGPTSGGTGTGLVTEEAGSRVRGWLFVVVIFAVVIAFVVILVLRRKKY